MKLLEEFEEFFEKISGNGLPQEFLESYAISTCLSSKEYCDTLLVKDRKTGQRLVAKCYKTETLQPPKISVQQLHFGGAWAPDLVAEYRNENYHCILWEYVEGIALNEYAEKHLLTQSEILTLARELAQSMTKLHESDPVIIHRDIKPENIIVRKDGTISLIDFGISRVYKQEQTRDTFLSGTENFAAPEQFGFRQTDIRSDIYSFGVVLSWLLTGKEAPIKEPKTRFEQIAAKCCAFAPEKRYQKDSQLLRDFDRLTEEIKVHKKKRKKWFSSFLI